MTVAGCSEIWEATANNAKMLSVMDNRNLDNIGCAE